MTTTTLISLLPYALLICGWICLLVSQLVPEKEKRHEFDKPKFWAISSIVCFVLSFVFQILSM